MSRIRRTSAGSVGSGNGRRGTPAAPRPERSRRRGGSRGRGSKPGGRGGRGADDDLFARSGVGSAPGSNAFVRDRGTSVRRLLMRLRDLRLRAGSRTSQANPVSLGQRPPPSCGIARRRDGRGARVAGRRRERPARGRTRMPAVVPQLARSYPDARGRTLDLPQGTTWHRKVRPREPTYDRASPRTTARAHVRPRDALGGSRTRLQPRVLRRTAHAPRKRPTAAGRVPDRDAHGSAEAVRFIGGPLARGPRGRHGRAPGASRRWLPSHGIPGPRDAEAGRPERRSPRRPHPGPGTRRREQVVMLPIDVGHRLPEARRRDAAPS